MKIVVTIPAFNEEETIGDVIRQSAQTLEDHGYGYEVIVVSDGSTDATVDRAREAGATVYPNPHNLGLAQTFRTEVERALAHGADIVVHIDADEQYPPAAIPDLLAPIVNGDADLVLGSRFAGTIDGMSFIKRHGNRLITAVVSWITGVTFTDTQTGFRAFTRDTAQAIEIISTHTYTQEQIIRAVRQQLEITEVPIHFSARRTGESRLISNSFGYALRVAMTLFRVERDHRPGRTVE